MKIIKIGILSLFAAFISFAANAQVTKRLRFNEIMSNNESGLINDFGVRASWIEIYNPSYLTIDLGGCYITNDKANPQKYRLPIGDVITRIQPRQFILIWADGISTHGILYTNFKLNPEGGYLALYSSDGHTMIDELEYPALAKDESYMCYVIDKNGKKQNNDDMIPGVKSQWGTSSEPTPQLQNIPHPDISQAEIFGQRDKTGGVMSITAMSVVFLALLVLTICFVQQAKIFIRSSKKKVAKAHGTDISSEQVTKAVEESGETYAAIAMALHLYQNDVHDFEDMIITIERESKQYSPWSSKWQSMRQLPIVRKN